MTREIHCPKCRALLRIPQGNLEAGSCPRCLAQIKLSGPDQAIAAAAPSRPATSAGNCVACGKSLQPGWAYCASCAHPVGAPLDMHPAPADADVRRDSKKTSLLLTLFAVIGGITLAIFGFAAVANLSERRVGTFLGIVVIAGILLLIGMGIVAMRKQNRAEEPEIGSYIFGALAFTGGLVFSIAALGFAAFAVLFIVCITGNLR